MMKFLRIENVLMFHEKIITFETLLIQRAIVG